MHGMQWKKDVPRAQNSKRMRKLKHSEATVDAANNMQHNNNTEMSDEERTAIRLMRDVVEEKDPSSKNEDDFMIRRFLRARDLDIGKASALFLKYLKWRKSFVPNGFISASEVQNHLAQNKLFMQGFDKLGRPLAVVLARRHFPTPGGIDEFKGIIVYFADKLITRMPPGQEKFTLLVDLEGLGYANINLREDLSIVSILQDYYPERLGKMIFINASYIFMNVWKLVYPFINKRPREKIMIVENKRLKATLLEEIDESQLPEIYGGKLPLVPMQDS